MTKALDSTNTSSDWLIRLLVGPIRGWLCSPKLRRRTSLTAGRLDALRCWVVDYVLFLLDEISLGLQKWIFRHLFSSCVEHNTHIAHTCSHSKLQSAATALGNHIALGGPWIFDWAHELLTFRKITARVAYYFCKFVCNVVKCVIHMWAITNIYESELNTTNCT